MVNAGILLCPACGRTSTEAVYKESATDHLVKLVRTPNGRYHLVSVKAEGSELVHDPSFDVKLRRDFSVSEEERGLPDQIEIELPAGSREEAAWSRCCPKCRVYLEEFATGLGRVPTFCIAMAGATSAGKTAWLDAASLGNNLEVLRNALRGFDIMPFATVNLVQDSGATQANSKGSTNFLKLIYQGKVVANIFFLDMAGEHYSKLNKLEKEYKRLLLGDGVKGYDGVDGLMFLEPLTQTTSKMAANEVYMTLNAGDKIHKIPVAYLRSRLDEIIRGEGTKTTATYEDFAEDGTLVTREVKVPLVDGNTFPPNPRRPYALENFENRLRLQNSIARTEPIATGVFALLSGTNCRGFLLQSCEPVGDESNPKNNYAKRINVLDPLVWMLLRLKLIPRDALRGGNP